MARTEEEEERETDQDQPRQKPPPQAACGGSAARFGTPRGADHRCLHAGAGVGMRSGADGGGAHLCGLEDAMDVVEESAMLHNHKKGSRGQFCRSWRSRVWTFLFFGFLEDAVLVDVLVPRVGKRFAEDNKVISVLQECIREGTEEDQNPVPFVPHERFLERLVEVIVDIPVPLIQEDIPEVIQVLSEQCVSEQLVDVPCLGSRRNSWRWSSPS